jgi:hypothetical protein
MFVLESQRLSANPLAPLDGAKEVHIGSWSQTVSRHCGLQSNVTFDGHASGPFDSNYVFCYGPRQTCGHDNGTRYDSDDEEVEKCRQCVGQAPVPLEKLEVRSQLEWSSEKCPSFRSHGWRFWPGWRWNFNVDESELGHDSSKCIDDD